MNIPKTLSVAISALNEERNIGNLLQDILGQQFDESFCDNFDLIKIFVVSDGSTDKTVEIVRDFQNIDKRINLIINEKRIGKIISLDKIFCRVDTDYVILFDADVRLKNDTINTLVKPLDRNSYDLIGGNPIPIMSKSFFNAAERASFFSWLIIQEIKKENPNSIYSAHGRILLASKKLYKNLDISELSSPGDDQFMYLKSNRNFYYEEKAIVFYSMPLIIGDYLKQNVRFRKAKSIKSSLTINKEIVNNEFKIKNKLLIFIKLLIVYPINGFLWLLFYFVGFLKYMIQKQDISEINKYWGEVKSTK